MNGGVWSLPGLAHKCCLCVLHCRGKSIGFLHEPFFLLAQWDDLSGWTWKPRMATTTWYWNLEGITLLSPHTHNWVWSISHVKVNKFAPELYPGSLWSCLQVPTVIGIQSLRSCDISCPRISNCGSLDIDASQLLGWGQVKGLIWKA